jgi:hypothetical protein
MKFGAALVFDVGAVAGEGDATEMLSGRTLADITAMEAVTRREIFKRNLQMWVVATAYAHRTSSRNLPRTRYVARGTRLSRKRST